MNRIKRLIAAVLLLAEVCCGTAAAAPDAAPIVLRYASPYPASHPFSRADIVWMKWVQAQAHGRLRIVPYWGGMLMGSAESVLELAHGVADVALVVPIYSLAGVQAIKLQASFYAGADTPEMQTAVYACLRQQFPVLDQELAGTRVLAVQGGSLLHILTRSRPIRTLADLRGLTLRAPDELVPTLRALGADPVTMAMGDVYSALSKGSVDGVVAPADTLLSLHFGEVAPWFSALTLPRGAYPARAIDARRWRTLPADVQDLLARSQSVWEQALDDSVTASQAAGYAFGRSHGEHMLDADPDAQQALLATYQQQNATTVQRVAAAQPYAPAMYAAAQHAVAALRAKRPPC